MKGMATYPYPPCYSNPYLQKVFTTVRWHFLQGLPQETLWEEGSPSSLAYSELLQAIHETGENLDEYDNAIRQMVQGECRARSAARGY